MGSQAGSCESQVDGNQIIKWVILQSDCGNLIGRGGEGIKKINEVSGSWVKVAHLEDSVRGAKERLVYIRGTPEQNLIALQIIIEKVGGWPFTTPVYDHEIAKIEDKITLYIPFLAIPIVLFEMPSYHANLFPTKSDEHPVIAGATVMIDANFFTSSAETQIHLIGPAAARERAKDIILERLRDWLSNPASDLSTSIDTRAHSPHFAMSSPSDMTATAGAAVGAGGPSSFHNYNSNWCDVNSYYEDLENKNNMLDSNSFMNVNYDDQQPYAGGKPAMTSQLSNQKTNNNNSNTVLSLSSLSNLLIPRQFSAQFANQFSANSAVAAAAAVSLQSPSTPSAPLSPNELMSMSYLDESKLLSPRSQLSQSQQNNANHLDLTAAAAGGGLAKLSLSREVSATQVLAQDILDCCVKVIISQEFVPLFESLSAESNQSICQYIHKVTSCYVQILPSHNIVTKSFNIAKIAVIGGSLTKILNAIDMLLDFVHSMRGMCHVMTLY
jgi:hypothetical protein